jgi:uncharacterized protein (DUF2141 family)
MVTKALTQRSSISALVAAAAVLTTALSLADPSPTAVLTIRITNLRSSNGQIGCTIYNSATGFPTDSAAALQRLWCPISSAAASCMFAPLPAGTYAVACFHDENNNGKLDTGFLGIPTEGTVASNHAKGLMGPPSFEKAKFTFSGVVSEMALRMGY